MWLKGGEWWDRMVNWYSEVQVGCVSGFRTGVFQDRLGRRWVGIRAYSMSEGFDVFVVTVGCRGRIGKQSGVLVG